MASVRNNKDYVWSTVRRRDKSDAICRYENNPKILARNSSKSGELRTRYAISQVSDRPNREYSILSDTEQATIYIEVAEEGFFIPLRLKGISEAIKEAEHILTFIEDWDGEGAVATDAPTFRRAVKFLVSYSTYLLKYGVIDKPFLDITRDGSISILWETEKASLIIIFKKDVKEISYLYGQEKDKKRPPFPYYIENGREVDEMLALWMSKHLI